MIKNQRRIIEAAVLLAVCPVCRVQAEETTKPEDKAVHYVAAVPQKLSGPVYIWPDDPKEEPEQILFTIEGRLPRNAYIEVTAEDAELEEAEILYALKVAVFTEEGLAYEPETELFKITIETDEEEAAVYFEEDDEFVMCEESEMTKKGITFETAVPRTFVIGIPVPETKTE